MANGVALLGGETADMPDLYRPGDYDLAGFMVGVVERDAIVDGSRIEAGDALIALPSTGPADQRLLAGARDLRRRQG